jgi:recombination protein RecA
MPSRKSANADTARVTTLESFLKDFDASSPGSLGLLASTAVADVEVIPTGVPPLDVALGARGLPKGKLVELYGPEGSGKSSLALSVAAEAQRLGGAVGYLDAECALNRDLALAMGVDPNRFVIAQPSSGEEGIGLVEEMVRSGVFALVVVDSIAALVPQAELDSEVTDNHMGLHARLVGKFVRRITALAAASGTLVICINQLRVSLAAYGNPETTTGGKALKYASSVRIEVRSGASRRIERDGRVVGQTVVVKVTKNKMAAPYRACEFDLYFGSGIDVPGSLLSAAEATGVITRAGASFTETATGERLGVGREAVRSRIAADPTLIERLKDAIAVGPPAGN